jgi:hypothetical protein
MGEFIVNATICCTKAIRLEGHRRTGEIQDDHDGVLQGRHGVHPHVRHHERGVVQQRPRLVSMEGETLTTCDSLSVTRLGNFWVDR